MRNALIVIVNYRTGDLTIDCLNSLRDEVGSLPGMRVVVTDNASGDDSPARIAAAISSNEWSSWATLQPLEQNGGFAAGNNAAIQPALQSDNPPDYVLLLNPDTIVRPGAIRALVDFMEAHPTVGIAGSRLEDPDGTPQRSAFRFPTALSELEEGFRIDRISRWLSSRVVAPAPPAAQCKTEWVAGASMIVRKTVFDAIGLLDERYFMYYEEVDFCRRAHDAGWECWYVPQSRVVHLVGQSSGVTDAKMARKRRPAYWFKSRRRYFLSHCGRFATFQADLFWVIGFAQWRVRQALMHRPDSSPRRMLTDFVRHNFFVMP